MIGFIGGGNMARALIKGMGGRLGEVIVYEPQAERMAELVGRHGVTAAGGNAEVVRRADIIVLAVKPQNMQEVLKEIAPLVTGQKTVVSIAAGITLKYLEDMLGTTRLVRVMPNMGAFIGQSMSVISMCDCLTDKDIRVVKDMLMASGRVIALPERHMDAVTALSGSGPAFVALFMDAMVRAGVTLGLPGDAALQLATQTFIGTSGLLDGELSPEKLIAMVRSPGGTTAEGLKVFEAEGLGAIVEKALRAAAARSKELAR